jgi:hypothetical protein
MGLLKKNDFCASESMQEPILNSLRARDRIIHAWCQATAKAVAGVEYEETTSITLDCKGFFKAWPTRSPKLSVEDTACYV